MATPNTGRSICGCQGAICPVAASSTMSPLRLPKSRKSPPTTAYRPSAVTLRSWTAPLLVPDDVGVPVWPWKYPPPLAGGTKPLRSAPVVASSAATWDRAAVPTASKSPAMYSVPFDNVMAFTAPSGPGGRKVASSWPVARSMAAMRVAAKPAIWLKRPPT